MCGHTSHSQSNLLLPKSWDMNLSIGIIGLPNAGKSTLFNALLGRKVANTAPYPFCTIEPNVGIVPVPDSRLDDLVSIVKKDHPDAVPTVTPAVVEFYDIAGLVKGAHQGEGLGNQFLSHIREVDALVQVVRGFTSDTVAETGSSHPAGDIATINTELILKDLDTLEKQKEPRAGVKLSLSEQNYYSGLAKLKKWLGEGNLASAAPLSHEEKDACASLCLLTAKPMIYILNVNEEELFQSLQENAQESLFLPICAKMEEELQVLTEEEQRVYLQEQGLAESGLVRLIKRCYNLLDLISFLTAGPKEVRAWSITAGTKAPQAGGIIHSDFERGFIRVAVISFFLLKKAGSFPAAKLQGLIREEGKDYEIQDGDVAEFRFSV